MREGRPSTTASLVAAIRAFYTALPAPYRLAPDPLAASIVPPFFALPARVASLSPTLAPALHRGLGLLSFGLSYHVPLRTRRIDDALRTAVDLGARQLVILGAGLDTRALRLDELASVAVFEVDYPATQRFKEERLARLAPPPRVRAGHLARVSIDFETQRLEDVLPAAGFRREERSFWIWEGVTVYLSAEAIEATLQAVSQLSAPGSRLAVTYGPVDVRALPFWAMPLAKSLVRMMGEPLKEPLLPEALLAMFERASLTRIEDTATRDWGARYWPELGGVRSIERLAVAEKRA
ncbi:MAG: SAM-dependent methyltransferase [Minicystis sp.]